MRDNCGTHCGPTRGLTVVYDWCAVRQLYVVIFNWNIYFIILFYIYNCSRLFNENRMWPTFVGPRFLIYGVSRITLPVLLWKEQERYIWEKSRWDFFWISFKPFVHYFLSQLPWKRRTYSTIFQQCKAKEMRWRWGTSTKSRKEMRR